MRKAQLGRTTLHVTELGFGAWAIGGEGEGLNYGLVDEADALACIETYIEAGGNHIDTARYYNESERIIGQVVRDASIRRGLVIASKTFETEAEGIRRELGESLRLLQIDTIDLYYLHVPPDDPGEMARALDVFEALRGEGLIRAIGASIRGASVTPATIDLCRQYIGAGRVDAIQLIYSILRQKTREVHNLAASSGVSLIGRTALESGFLTGKYRPSHRFDEGDHRSRWGADWLAQTLGCCHRLAQTAVREPYETLAQAAIRFAMRPEAITSTLVGARTPAQMHANLSALRLPPLDADLTASLIDEYGDRTEEFNGA